MKIGLLGLTFQVGNKGCEALSYSFLEVLNKIAKKNKEIYQVYLVTNLPKKRLIKNFFNINKAMSNACPKKKFENIEFNYIFYINYKMKNYFLNKIEKCDVVFDFTAGDSFTDIYGKERFYKRTNLKKQIIEKGVNLVLGSQTIGPFHDEKVKKLAIEVIKKSKEVFVRDQKSYDYTKEISGRTPILTTDIAFELPYTIQKKKSEKIKIGFNASGLLWSGGYTNNNQFNLKTDYQRYCLEVIGKLLENPNHEIYLISHATSNKKGYPDNDLIAAKAIKEYYPQTIFVNVFDTAMDAKSYISKMDFFIGARMHATVAALSTKVPVIPVSYSRKFEGLYESLNYPFVISATKLATEEAIKKTIEWFYEVDLLKKAIEESSDLIEKKNEFLEEKIENVIYSCIKNGGKDV